MNSFELLKILFLAEGANDLDFLISSGTIFHIFQGSFVPLCLIVSFPLFTELTAQMSNLCLYMPPLMLFHRAYLSYS